MQKCRRCKVPFSEGRFCPKCGRDWLGQGPSHARDVDFGLGIAIFALPYFFSWFTLRKGHTIAARVVSFTWLVLAVIIVCKNSPITGNLQARPSSFSSKVDESVRPKPKAIRLKSQR